MVSDGIKVINDICPDKETDVVITDSSGSCIKYIINVEIHMNGSAFAIPFVYAYSLLTEHLLSKNMMWFIFLASVKKH